MICVHRKSKELFPAAFCPIIRFRVAIFSLQETEKELVITKKGKAFHNTFWLWPADNSFRSNEIQFCVGTSRPLLGVVQEK